MTALPMFFVIGLPRSGTTWLARLIADCNPDWLICHEAYHADFALDVVTPFRPWEAEAYMLKRVESMKDRIEGWPDKKGPLAGYGEITPRVRYFSAEFVRFYPDATFIHLVRDPRRAVPSMMNFGYYAGHGRKHRTVAPDANKWSQVERASWAWAYGHHRIRQKIKTFARFEDLLGSWTAIETLCSVLGVECPESIWRDRVGMKVNPSTPQTPAWEDWTPKWRKQFAGMCRVEAAHYGYLEV